MQEREHDSSFDSALAREELVYWLERTLCRMIFCLAVSLSLEIFRRTVPEVITPRRI